MPISRERLPVLAAVSTAMVVATLAIVLLLERLVGLQLFVEEEGRDGRMPVTGARE